jgi:hypothetical protein
MDRGSRRRRRRERATRWPPCLEVVVHVVVAVGRGDIAPQEGQWGGAAGEGGGEEKGPGGGGVS